MRTVIQMFVAILLFVASIAASPLDAHQRTQPTNSGDIEREQTERFSRVVARTLAQWKDSDLLRVGEGDYGHYIQQDEFVKHGAELPIGNR